MPRLPLTALFSLAATLALAAPALAGPLTPPAGPVASTGKTIAQAEPRTPISSLPFTISQPGSYYLTADLTATQTNAPGILIMTGEGGVTIDLNGFALRGIPGSNSAIYRASQSAAGITIRNGAIIGWGQTGVHLANSASVTITDVEARNCGQVGFHVGADAVLINCRAISNGGHGFIAAAGSASFTRCTARANGGRGFVLNDRSRMTECVADANTAGGVQGGNHCTITDSSVYANNTPGIAVSTFGVITRNTIIGAETAVSVQGQSTITHNNIATAEYGARLYGPGNFLGANIFRGTTFAYFSYNAGQQAGPLAGPAFNHPTVITNENPWTNFVY